MIWDFRKPKLECSELYFKKIVYHLLSQKYFLAGFVLSRKIHGTDTVPH